MLITDAPMSGHNYSDLIIREKVHVDAARLVVFFNRDHFLLENIFAVLRHIPTYKDFHSWVPFRRNRNATNVTDTSSPCIHICPACTIYCR